MIINNTERQKPVVFARVLFSAVLLSAGVLLQILDPTPLLGVSWATICYGIGLTSLIITLLFYRESFIFEGDGEALVFKNQDIIFGFLNRGAIPKTIEFPRGKLRDFKIQSWPFRKALIIEIESKRSKTNLIKRDINISFLGNKEISLLKQELEWLLQTRNNKQEEQVYNTDKKEHEWSKIVLQMMDN